MISNATIIHLLTTLRWAHQADPADKELFDNIKSEVEKLKAGELNDPALAPHIDDLFATAIAARALPKEEASDENDLESKTVAELKEICEKRGIDVSGLRLKQEYIDAITADDANS